MASCIMAYHTSSEFSFDVEHCEGWNALALTRSILAFGKNRDHWWACHAGNWVWKIMANLITGTQFLAGTVLSPLDSEVCGDQAFPEPIIIKASRV
jgi:hypothetical protein